MTPYDFAACVEHLRERLQEPLPGHEARLRMAPAHRMDPNQARIDGKNCREAGVLALLFPLNEQPMLVLTVRRDHLPDHPGQISFPGGQREAGETLREAALRESHEEIGLDPSGVEILGTLTPLHIPPSGFCVYPFVGALHALPTLRPTDAEVAEILRVSLAHLRDPATRVQEERILHDERAEVPFFAVQRHKVWGATAMMLAELLMLFENGIPAVDG